MIPIIKLIIIVIIFIILVSRKWNIGLIMLLGSLLTGIFFLMPPLKLLKSIAIGTIHVDTIKLIVTVYFTLSLGFFLKEFGYFNNLTSSLGKLIPNRYIALTIPPAIIGFIPMPAGAMLSAPMLEEGSKGLNISAELKTFINFWFRHPWEYCWPIYLGIILASTVLSIPIRSIILTQYPLTFAVIAAGIIFGFPKLLGGTRTAEHSTTRINLTSKGKESRKFFLNMWPILLVFILVVAAKIDVIIALALTMFIVIFLGKTASPGGKQTSKETILTGLKKGFMWDIILLLVSVMIFKRVLEDSGALLATTGFFETVKLSSLVLIAFIPFIVGFLTGVSTAFVGIAFPMLLPLLTNNLNHVMFAYAWGFGGVLLSPVHLCLVITQEYFKANLWKVYKYLLPATGFVMLVACILLWLRMGL